jgi:hypothetical protein
LAAIEEGYGRKEAYDIIAADKVEGTAMYNMAGDKVGTIKNDPDGHSFGIAWHHGFERSTEIFRIVPLEESGGTSFPFDVQV